MQDRQLTVLKAEGTGRVGKHKLRWLESGGEDLRKMGVRTGDVSSRFESSGGQLW